MDPHPKGGEKKFCNHGNAFYKTSVFFCCTAYQILDLCQEKDQIAKRVHDIIDKFAERGLRSLAVAYQVISMIPFFVPFLLKGSLNEEKDVNVAY